MPRSNRIQAPGTYYHIMNRGLAHQDIIFNTDDYFIFLKGIQELREIYKVDIFAFCLMTNHYHLLIRTSLANLSRAMRHFSHTFAQRMNRRTGRDGPVFRGRFKSIVIEHEDYLRELARYIHLNPVEAGIVTTPSQYSWSSAKSYDDARFPEWSSGMELLGRFGMNLELARSAYAAHLNRGNSLEILSFYSRERLGPVLNEDTVLRAVDCAIKMGKISPGT